MALRRGVGVFMAVVEKDLQRQSGLPIAGHAAASVTRVIRFRVLYPRPPRLAPRTQSSGARRDPPAM